MLRFTIFSFDKMKPWFCCILLFLPGIFGEQEKMLYNRNGDLSIIGVFNSFSGEECTTEMTKGLEETASAIWTVEALNDIHYLLDITIGLSVFDGCRCVRNQTMLSGAQFSDNKNIGILTSQEIYNKMENFSNSTMVELNHVIKSDLLVELTLELLLNLQWMTLRAVVSDSRDVLDLFRNEVEEERIKVEDYVLINERNFDLNLSSAQNVETSSVIVVIAANANISNIREKILHGNCRLIITPTDYTFDLKGFPNDTIVLLPSMEGKSVLSKYIKNTARYKNFFSHKGPTKSPLFIGTAVSILKLLKPAKSLLEEHCKDMHSEHPCSAKTVDFLGRLSGNKTSFAASKRTEISPDDILETLNVLKIKPSLNDEMFLYIATVLNVSEDLSIFKIFNMQTKKFGPVLLKINDNLVRNGEMFLEVEPEFGETKEFTNSLIGLSQSFPSEGNLPTENVTLTLCDENEECKNFPESPSQNATDVLGWRFLTWVCINTALAFTGVTCTLSLMLFITIRLFKGALLESSLCFNLLLMLCVIFMYGSSLLFHLEYLSDNRLLCLSRINVPPVICAILFSLLLSRSLMVAFNERNSELGDHLNGYLHSILCILMISLQVSITIQNWKLEHIDDSCSQVHDQYRLIIALSYNFILLICLACLSPFIICSKRNNKEGLLISICVFFITVVWSTWISFYILFSNEYKDAATAVGLNATATVIVICIFIPRTYFMTVPDVRDSRLCYIPTLGKLADGLNINGQSSQNLHDAVGGISYKNCELGTSNPNFYTTRSDEDNGGGFIRESAVDLSSETSQAK